jgi:glucose-1-phosphate thymidylyltransferase
MTKAKEEPSKTRELVGVLPAAGAATRLGRLPCSKEILPLAFADGPDGRPRLRVATDCALEALRAAGVRRAVMVIASGKDDIPAFLGDGGEAGPALEYRRLASSPGAAWSIDEARGSVGDADTALVFPDIQFRPPTALRDLARAAAAATADVWLALVPSRRGEKVDLVQTDSSHAVTGIDIKPGAGHEGWTWVAALWRPAFADFLHERLGAVPPGSAERHVGDFINDALAAGLTVRGLPFPDGAARDVGTADDLLREWRGENGR